jgi:hypothetical protein
MHRFQVGEHVIYRKQKASPKPGPHAVAIAPAEHGEDYWYFVDKYWTVSQVFDDGSFEIVTRRGKTHRLQPDDPHLRRANLLEQWLHRERFPVLGQVQPAPKERHG